MSTSHNNFLTLRFAVVGSESDHRPAFRPSNHQVMLQRFFQLTALAVMTSPKSLEAWKLPRIPFMTACIKRSSVCRVVVATWGLVEGCR